ncbi:hypothetical protein AQI95_19575 [Streptomyces yokosukanensis]|uniref:Condensation domain-containing protein n=1 Tax=Streptomyces yokosukanensis TaxID=67386 RepID=A0A101P440_9ACTN|nr:condensation domain-containing protein [Streptomyces yokosukanensis]KUN04545.1 hypothetical protein AQI95_19575 [Streptomyces yokosukanensis]
MATPVLRLSPLSWQQESLLLRPSPFGAGEIHTDFPVPDEVTDDELLRRAQRLADRESALRIVDHGPDGVVQQEPLQVRLHHHTCESPADVREFIARSRHQDFPHTPGEPRWRLTVIRHRDGGGRPARTAFALFDHFIADRVSVALVRRELSTGVPARPGDDAADGYLAWVERQRAEFDPHTHQGLAAARFWRRHLDGVSPHQATPVPVFTDAPRGDTRGTAWYSVHVALPPGAVRQACRATAATPSVLVLSSIAATTASACGADDLTLRLITGGRTPGSATTIGWLNTCVPVRLRDRELGTLRGALAATRTAWQEILPYQHTPWEYLWRTCAPEGAPAHGWLAGHRQLVVNFFPDVVDGLTEADYADRTDDFEQQYLALYVVPLADGGFMLRLIGDAGEVDPTAARRYLDALRDGLLAHVRESQSTDTARVGALAGSRP